jgi:dimethylargininase
VTVRISNAIVRAPASNFGDGITTASLGAPNFEKAREQHAVYCAALQAAGATVTVLAPDAAHPDGHFVEDPAVVIGGRAVLTRPGAAARRGETDAMRAPLARFFTAVDEIVAPGTVDGGDVCEAGDCVYVGISHRTNRAGAEQLGNVLASLGRTAVFVDIRTLSGILHLKGGLAYLGENRFVAIDALLPLFDVPLDRIVRVTPGEEFGANCVRVNDVVLIAAGHPQLQKDLTLTGYQTVILDVSEFRKMDGGLSCLSLRF